ncbi:hypothetical protein Mtc_1168 [Methanocella conradii HZ254]|uniref:Uncharacterized protein n=1 Tax=Methanocella conradii (strain DSM 24694 / JCM 17849 / CGMCC 1.5162 / HZ254) TaxID=1041930 RepID=H8I7T9_METCZ|nr:pyruvate kinase alpha/beta domain-containing protein [Methanocella conradii]AFC99924.1 hypothetical protein Mtc_1168 [Methanocella conradii HZ254]MDI6897271.1 pyruvate kinase alpha/beta domain-containing protein [Methanocella conradii]
MIKEIVYYFTAPGERNTNATLKMVREWAQKYGIKRAFIPSKSGQTAQKAYNLFKNSEIKMTVVGTDPNVFSSEILAQLKGNGIRVCFYKDIPYTYPHDMKTAYRRMGEGFKVAVELGMIAAYLDEGDDSDAICLGGTKKGVDTALVIKPAKSEAFDQLEVREIIAKPRTIKA